MIPDLAGLLCPERPPSPRDGGGCTGGGTLEVDERVVRKPATFFEARHRFLEQPRGEGWIEEGDVERFGRRRVQEAPRIALLDSTCARAPFLEARSDLAGGSRIALDESHLRRATGQRLEPECAATREEVEAACPRHAGCEPVEESLADAIRSGTDPG